MASETVVMMLALLLAVLLAICFIAVCCIICIIYWLKVSPRLFKDVIHHDLPSPVDTTDKAKKLQEEAPRLQEEREVEKTEDLGVVTQSTEGVGVATSTGSGKVRKRRTTRAEKQLEEAEAPGLQERGAEARREVSPGPFKDVTHPPPVDTSDKAKKLQGGAPRLQKNGGVEKTGILLQSTDSEVASAGLGPGHSGKSKRRKRKMTTTGTPEKPLEKAEAPKLKERGVDTRREVSPRPFKDVTHHDLPSPVDTSDKAKKLQEEAPRLQEESEVEKTKDLGVVTQSTKDVGVATSTGGGQVRKRRTTRAEKQLEEAEAPRLQERGAETRREVSPGPFKDVTHHFPPPVDTSDKAKKLQGGAPRLQKNGGVEKTGILLQSTDSEVASAGLGPGHSGKSKRRQRKRTTTGAPEKPLEKAEAPKLKERGVDTRCEVSPRPFKDVTHHGLPPPVDTTDKAKKLQEEAPRLQEEREVEKTEDLGVVSQSTVGVATSDGPSCGGQVRKRRTTRAEKLLEEAEAPRLQERGVQTRRECHAATAKQELQPQPSSVAVKKKGNPSGATLRSAQLPESIDAEVAVTAFQSQRDVLLTAIHSCLTEVANKLFAKFVISREVLEKACHDRIVSRERAAYLLSCVQDRIKTEPADFVKVVDILESKPTLIPQAKQLVDSY